MVNILETEMTMSIVLRYRPTLVAYTAICVTFPTTNRTLHIDTSLFPYKKQKTFLQSTDSVYKIMPRIFLLSYHSNRHQNYVVLIDPSLRWVAYRSCRYTLVCLPSQHRPVSYKAQGLCTRYCSVCLFLWSKNSQQQ